MEVFSKILKIQKKKKSQKLRFCEFGLRKNTATVRQTLVQPPDQTKWPSWMKFGMHLPKGIPYGGFFENFEISNFFFPKNCVLSFWTLKI